MHQGGTPGAHRGSRRRHSGHGHGGESGGRSQHHDGAGVGARRDNPGEKLKPGATVRVAIIAETIQDTMVVPASALLNWR